MEKHRTIGIIAAPFSPINSDGEINCDRVPAILDHLVDNGVKGIFICGSTGEGPSLTIEERKALAEAFVLASRDRIKTFVHVGHNSIYEAKKLAAHAQAIGADAISATVPTYFKIEHPEALVSTMEVIASGAPNLPFYYYHIPKLTGMNIDTAVFLDMAIPRIDNLVGVKYTSAKINEYEYCLEKYGDELDILFGYDELMLSALAVGAKGFIGSTYNFCAPVYLGLMDAFYRGDMDQARKMQMISVEMVRIIVKYGGLPAQKAMMKMVGVDCGPVRAPLLRLTESQYLDLEKELGAVGFFKALNLTKEKI